MALFIPVSTDWLTYFDYIRATVFALGVFLNLYLLASTIACRFSNKSSQIPLVTQALIDALVCLAAIFYIGLNSTLGKGPTSSRTSWAACYLWISNLILFVLIGCSILNQLNQSVDRLLAVKFPMFYRLRNNILVGLMMSSMLILSVLINLVITTSVVFESKTKQCLPADSSAQSQKNALFWIIFFYFLPAFVSVLVGFLTNQKIRSVNTSNTANSTKSISNRLAITVSLAVVGQTLFTAPDQIYFLVAVLNPRASYVEGSPLQVFTSTMMILIHAITPISYFALLPRIRSAGFKLVTCRKFIKSNNNASSTLSGHVDTSMASNTD